MAPPPTFRRSPRLYPQLPSGEVEIPPPTTLSAPPQTSWLSMLLPGGATVVGMTLMVSFGTAGPMGYTMVVVSLLGILASFVVTFSTHRGQKRGSTRAVQHRKEAYNRMLKDRDSELRQLWGQQQAALQRKDPSLEECLARVRTLNRQLWERGPGDPDFLAPRIGKGTLPATFSIKAPHQDPLQPTDPLIADAQALVTKYSTVDTVPICLPLTEVGVTGVAGSRRGIIESLQALAIHLATHHSPDEVKFVVVYPSSEGADWAWLRWLPHVWTDAGDRLMACEKTTAHMLLMDLYELLTRRRDQLQHRHGRSGMILPVLVVFLADPDVLAGEPAVDLLLNEGPTLGAFPICVAHASQYLPKACQAVVEILPNARRLIRSFASDGSMGVSQRAPHSVGSTKTTDVVPDSVSAELPDRFARIMAPVELERMSGPADLPGSLTLLDLLGVDTVERLDVLERWKTSDPVRSLAAPIGKHAGNEVLSLDIHERGHGPHGLVAGTTGSGKTAFLSAYLALLAVQFHPHELAILAIDYKGGDLIRELQDLPHLVGTITNLQGHLSTRAIQALHAENERRQRCFNLAGVGNIYDYQRLQRAGKVTEPLPHLLIISDEFAELVKNQPLFMEHLDSTARVGRSLGVHLLLATQDPSGVVNDQIWGNARFRISFRLLKREQSMAILKRPEAAAITQPGRAYLQVGENETFELFQAAWGGAFYQPVRATNLDKGEIFEVLLDGKRRPLRTLTSSTPTTSLGQTQLTAIATHICDVARQAGIQRLPSPWLPPLPDMLMLSAVHGRSAWNGRTWSTPQQWLAPVVGLLDQPSQQAQQPLQVSFASEGHLVVYGAPGSGKTTFLQTLLVALVLDYSPADVAIYMLDFGGRLLSLFAGLPHVGAVITADESERFERLLRYIQRELDTRKEHFARAGVNNLTAYRAASGATTPAIIVMLDNYAGFTASYPDAELHIAALAREGANLGVYLVLTATSHTALRIAVSSNIGQAIALQLSDRADYAAVVGRTSVEPQPIPGRGLIKATPPLEFQTALPLEGRTQAERSAAMRQLAATMDQAWAGQRPRPIGVLPDAVPLHDLVSPASTAWQTGPACRSVPIGVEVEDLDPVSIDLRDGPNFLITGPIESGKTTLLHSWLLALATCTTPDRLWFYLIDFKGAGLFPLARLPHVRCGLITDAAQLASALEELTILVRERRAAVERARRAAGGVLDESAFISRFPAVVIAVDDLQSFNEGAQYEHKGQLEAIIRQGRGLGVHVLVTGSTGDLTNNPDVVGRAIKEQQIGVLLGSTEYNDLTLFNLRMPASDSGKYLPPGEGYVVRRGRYRRIKVATPHTGPLSLAAWVELLGKRKI